VNTSVPHVKPFDVNELARALAAITAGEPAIVAAYLFGSVARGTTTPLSDIDVALLVRSDAEAADVCGRVGDALARRCATGRIDVVALNGAPPPLRYHVIRDGRVVVRRDAGRLERFIADTVREYLDVQPLRERAFHILRQNILSTTHGR
jgi:predicted nucleotidyltransferase